MNKYIGPERRGGEDRRLGRKAWLPPLKTEGRRVHVRRRSDRKRIFPLDRYGASIFALIMAILLLSLTDAMLTLILLNHGAVELNPVMAFYIDLGPEAFLITKYLLTALPLVFMLFFKDWLSRRFAMGHLLMPAVAGVFGSIILWELYLMSKVGG